MISDKKKHQEALQMVMTQINDKFGKNSVLKMDSIDSTLSLDVCSTGSLKLDKILGVGGLPYGRIVEIYGPESSGKTTLCLSVVAQAQKSGKTCVYVDAENALDVYYARKLGVDIDNLYMSQPSSGEEALSIVETMINSGAVDVIVVDSVAALVPRAEIEGEMGDSHIGLAARLMSQALRKITAAAKQNNVLLIFINQIRIKIGVMFGCLHGDSKINFVDGRVLPISDVVNNKITGEVWSLNEKTGYLEAKPIVDWHHNGYVDKPEDYQIISHVPLQSHVFESRQNRYKSEIALTLYHNVFVKDKGWIKSKDIQVGDIVISRKTDILNGELLDFVKGLLVSGTKIKYNRLHGVYDLKLKPSRFGSKFDDWIANKLFAYKMQKNDRGVYFSNLITNNELAKWVHKNANPLRLFKERIPDWSMFLWAMEKSFIQDDKLYLSTYYTREHDLTTLSHLLSNSGYHNRVVWLDNRLEYAFEFLDGSIIDLIEDYIDLSLPNSQFDQYIKLFDIQQFDNRCNRILRYKKNTIIDKSKVVGVRQLSEYQFNRDSGKYDISVADNHNYLAGNMIVHNSPETTTGGNALKFYSSIRLDIRKVSSLKRGEDVYGNDVKIKVVKNKVSPPFKEAHVELLFNIGFNQTGELLDLAVEQEVVNKAGAWYSYNGNKIGHGRENVITFLNGNPDLKQEILEKID